MSLKIVSAKYILYEGTPRSTNMTIRPDMLMVAWVSARSATGLSLKPETS